MKHQFNLTSRLRQLALAAAVVACAVPLTMAMAGPMDWIGGVKVQGSGKVVKQTRALAHFTGVNLNVPGDMELRLGNTESITIETDDNLLPLIESVIADGVLRIRPVKRNTNLHARTLHIVVYAKNIDRLALSGSGSIDSDALKGNKLQFDIGGSGSINVKGMEAEAVAISVGGSGDLKSGAGKANTLSVSIGGSGDVDVGKVQVGDASVSVAGSGEATVWANRGLSVTIAGSGDVNYYGDPKVSTSVVGSGDITRMGSSPR
ncbi:head GIN domain-containing protein [Massilia sp. TWP1-3-3]|uniref:head GIN domain-containing protein n=1 Tax=Massilia sp. TWP1-3-3 TaxID=2804573 RepID=UPI003CF7EBDD